MKSRLESILRSTFYRRPRLLLLLGAAIVVWIATCKPKHDPLGVVPPPTEEPTFVPTPDSLLPKVITTYPGKEFPQIFEAAFCEGTAIEEIGYTRPFSSVEMGSISLHSSKVIACDPIHITDAQPFVDDFPTGTFPVQMARLESDNAFCRILFSNAQVAEWQVALQPGEKPVVLGKEAPYCYGVDTGLGVFIDGEAREAFATLGDHAVEDMIDWREGKPYPTAAIYPFGKASLVLFTTGAGDGCYAVYVGRDSSGLICRLLVDFGMVEWY